MFWSHGTFFNTPEPLIISGIRKKPAISIFKAYTGFEQLPQSVVN